MSTKFEQVIKACLRDVQLAPGDGFERLINSILFLNLRLCGTFTGNPSPRHVIHQSIRVRTIGKISHVGTAGFANLQGRKRQDSPTLILADANRRVSPRSGRPLNSDAALVEP
ncbi:hypothetical protein VTO73DRAFT_10593 [Trametes versicolor]